MSGLFHLRTAIRDKLVAAGWLAAEILIKRRTDIWNDVAVATQASRNGRCLVIGVASGKAVPGRSMRTNRVMTGVTIPLTLIELPTVNPNNEEFIGGRDEESAWEEMVMALQGDPLGRPDTHYALEFESFEDVEDEDYVIRQTIFTTNLLLGARDYDDTPPES